MRKIGPVEGMLSDRFKGVHGYIGLSNNRESLQVGATFQETLNAMVVEFLSE